MLSHDLEPLVKCRDDLLLENLKENSPFKEVILEPPLSNTFTFYFYLMIFIQTYAFIIS